MRERERRLAQLDEEADIAYAALLFAQQSTDRGPMYEELIKPYVFLSVRALLLKYPGFCRKLSRFKSASAREVGLHASGSRSSAPTAIRAPPSA